MQEAEARLKVPDTQQVGKPAGVTKKKKKKKDCELFTFTRYRACDIKFNSVL
jgi:hypothetical protein